MNKTGYSAASIGIHWITAIAIVALFFTHEGERDSLTRLFHLSGGALLGIFLIWRVVRRFRMGLSAKPDQAEILNLLSRLVLWGLLAVILVTCLSGYLLPWTGGRAFDFFGMSIPSPIAGNHTLHEIFEEVHDIGGHLFIPLIALHVAGVIKHALFDSDKSVAKRMSKSISNGI